ncbi:MAG: AsmA-like C-terminal domain-containing protein, partial [Sulfurimonas sp.]
LAGYIIFDGETLSTKLKIRGKLSDPKVTTMVTKDIVSAPVNIMKRTLKLPFKLINGILK